MNTTDDNSIIQTKILFVTNSESGRTNTILALAPEAVTHPQVKVHIASTTALKPRIEQLSPELNFHSLDGESMYETASTRGLREEDLPHPPMTKSLEPCARTMTRVISGRDGERAFLSSGVDGI